MASTPGLTHGACPACGGPLAAWRTVPGGEPADPWLYPLERCGRCGTAVTGGPPPGPDAYTGGVYAPGDPRLRGLVRALQRLASAQAVRALRRGGLPPRARVLDAGAGTGRLVAELRRRGLDARGIEPSPRSVEIAERAGRPVVLETIAGHEDSDLDAAVLWHVLEHLDEPLAALKRVGGWLAPGGLLLVGVPNVASLQARIARERWLHFDAPRHRLHLTPAGLNALIERAGLSRVRTIHFVWEHNPVAMWMALLSRAGMTPGFPFHLLKRNVQPRPRDLALLAAGLPLLPAAAAAEALAAAARRGGTIAMVAQRRA